MDKKGLQRLENIRLKVTDIESTQHVQYANSFGKPEVMPSGFPELDKQVMQIGGLPKGRITELAGETGAGKSTLALNIMAQAIASGESCVYCDIEGTHTFEYGELIGCPRSEYLMHPGLGLDGSKYLESILNLIEAGATFIILDSLSFIASDDISETELSDMNMKTANMSTPMLTKLWTQKLYSGWKRKLPKTNKESNIISLLDTPCTIIIISHLKEKFGESKNPRYKVKDSGGGETIKFAYSIRLFLENFGFVYDEQLKDSEGNPIFKRVKISCPKHKLATPGRSAVMHVDSRSGRFLTQPDSILQFAKTKGIFTSKGAYYYWSEEITTKTKDPEIVTLQKIAKEQDKFHGKDAAVGFINNHPELLAYIMNTDKR
jgi:recombination protein RecA